MLIPIRCACGLPIGDVAVIFQQKRAERVKEALKDRNVVPTQAVIDTSLQIDMTDIMEELGITEDHCKRTINTAMDFRMYY